MRFLARASSFSRSSKAAMTLFLGSFLVGVGYHLYLAHLPAMSLSAAVGAGVLAGSLARRK
jgi:hypothetical protein